MLDNWQLIEETQQVPTIDQQALLAQMHDAKELRKERDRARKRNMSEEQRNRAKELAYVSCDNPLILFSFDQPQSVDLHIDTSSRLCFLFCFIDTVCSFLLLGRSVV